MADEPSASELQRRLDHLTAEIRDIRSTHVTEKVLMTMHNALADRIARLEQTDTTRSTGNRQWGLGIVQTVIGVILGAIAGVLTAKGGK